MQYVAHAYSYGNTEKNVKLVQEYLNDHWLKPDVCFSPVTMFHEQNTFDKEGEVKDTKWWAALCRKFLVQADELIVIIGKCTNTTIDNYNLNKIILSSGVLAEIAVASMLDIKIKYVYKVEDGNKWYEVNETLAYETKSFIEDEKLL